MNVYSAFFIYRKRDLGSLKDKKHHKSIYFLKYFFFRSHIICFCEEHITFINCNSYKFPITYGKMIHFQLN